MTTEPPPSQPPPPGKPDTLWPTLCHVGGLCGSIVPLGNLLVPFVIWQIKKDELPEVAPHAKEVLNFQITLMLVLLICAPAALLGVWLVFPLFLLVPLVSAIAIGALVCTIIGIIRASEGKFYTYPLTIRFIK